MHEEVEEKIQSIAARNLNTKPWNGKMYVDNLEAMDMDIKINKKEGEGAIKCHDK